MYKTILVPLDGSRAANRAFAHAEALADAFGASLVLLRVTERVMPPAGALHAMAIDAGVHGVEIAEAQMEADRTKASSQLNGHRRRLQRAGIEVKVRVELGNPADSIERVARAEKADLIVMTTRGRGGIKRAVLGSVADEVVKANVAPVLLVKR
jgi:nucleotide-binding universal stress UspA family protein